MCNSLLRAPPLKIIAAYFAEVELRELLARLRLDDALVQSCPSSGRLPRLLKGGADLIMIRLEQDPASLSTLLSTGSSVAPVLCVCSGVAWDAEQSALRAGADAVIDMSAPEPLVQAHVRSLLRRSRREYEVALGRDLWYDCNRKVVRKGDVARPLTPAAFGLFRVLALSIGAWVSSDAILRSLNLRLTGEAGIAFVRQRVQALRKALLGSGLNVSFTAAHGARLWKE